MPDVVTAAELAAEVEVTPQRLGRWLRQAREAGHPLLVKFPAGSLFRFSRAAADQLAAEFVLDANEVHVSDSAVQRRAAPRASSATYWPSNSASR